MVFAVINLPNVEQAVDVEFTVVVGVVPGDTWL